MHKFMHENDLVFMSNSYLYDRSPLELLTVMWSAKEALFKWFSLGGVDFKDHMQLRSGIEFMQEELLLPFVFKREEHIHVAVYAKLFDKIVLSWIITKT